MKKGNVFIDKEGADISRITTTERNRVLRDYYMMRDKADSNDDQFFFVNAQEWEDFYLNLWNPDDPYWEGVDMTYITSLQNGSYPLKMIDNISDFDLLQEPKSHGGYGYDDHPTNGYIYDPESWEYWHHQWNLEHIDQQEADKLYNGIWPRINKVSTILSEELKSLGKSTSSDVAEIVNIFHEQVMKHLDERARISASKRIGAAICEANYYHREEELEKLEAVHGNNHAEKIYSIKIGAKYQFLCIDKQHGMLELCNDKGDHQMEIRFDGTKNKDGDAKHSLQCVAEWKRNLNKNRLYHYGKRL